MTFGDFKTRVGYFVPELIAAEISKHINNRYQQILGLWQWSFLKKQATLTLTANQALYPLAADVKEMTDVICTSKMLTQRTLLWLDKTDPARGAAAGLPTEW
ncbi:MAG: hypothetical protein COW28_03165, partial [bacterium (Candidatus Ratteibacteria) CG15_BIG_FIL_POST_REV_8_21_14_020_41_12]